MSQDVLISRVDDARERLAYDFFRRDLQSLTKVFAQEPVVVDFIFFVKKKKKKKVEREKKKKKKKNGQ